MIMLLLFVIVEWFGRKEKYPIANFGLKLPRVMRWIFYYGLIFVIFFLAGQQQQFIYFQF